MAKWAGAMANGQWQMGNGQSQIRAFFSDPRTPKAESLEPKARQAAVK
jgi:hypothetical protein